MTKEINKRQISAYPTSYIQKRIWFLEKIEKGRIKNNIGIVSYFSGIAGAEDLREVFQKIVDRHEILRTNFYETESEELVQVVHENQIANFSYFDLRLAEDKEEQKEKLIDDLQNKSFDLAQGNLIRFTLIRLAEDKQVVIIVGHHIVIDSWSMSVIATEFFQLAQALFYKEPDKLPALSIQYKDYAAWEQSEEFDQKNKEAEKYWLETLAGDLPILDLPLDKPRPLLQNYEVAIETIEIDATQKRIIDQFCRKYDITLFVFFYAILNIILKKLSGQEEIVIGTYAANRDLPELDGVVGPLLNSLVMRFSVEDDEKFSEFLLKIKEQVLLNLKYKDYPFEKLVERLAPNRDVSRVPIFNTVFQVFNSGGNSGIKKNIFFERTDDYQTFDKTLGQFDLSFHLHNREEDLLLALSYNKNLFNQDSIKRYLTYFREILSDLSQAEEKLIKDINIIPEAEKKILSESALGENLTLLETDNIFKFFNQQALKTPEALALISGEEKYTYQELRRQVNLFATYFSLTGIKEGVVVGLALSRTEDYLVSVLALLRLGAICVPINKNDPEARLDFIRQDADIKFIISDSQMSNFSDSVQIIDIEDARNNKEEIDLVSNEINLDSDAFILYTSGSTGRPKGVKLKNRGIINHAFGKINFLSLESNDRVAQTLSTSFVASLWQFFSPLFVGASVVIYPDEIVVDFPILFDAIEKDGITIWETNASIISYLLTLRVKNFSAQLKILLTGEDTPDALVEKFYSVYNLPLINSYGQTECSDDTLMYQIPFDKPKVLLGKPLFNTQVYILDKNLNLVPTMTKGEIYISGDCLSVGYINNKEENNNKFLSHPFLKNKLIYKTGDLGRRLESGDIEYLGRVDRQIKIRGVRIELSEIENILLSRKDINNCLVIARNKDLILYYTGKKIEPSELRIYLATFLPILMLPTYYIHLEKFPFNVNSKIDKRKLPEPQDADKAYSQGGPIKTEMEKLLALIWQKILRVNDLNGMDDFFALGGNSLRALSLVSELRNLGYQVSLRDVFRFSRLSDLGRFLENKKISKTLKGGLPMTAFGDWLKNHNFNFALLLPSLCLEVQGLDSDRVLESAQKIKDNFNEFKISVSKEDIQSGEELQKRIKEESGTEEINLQILLFKNKLFLKAQAHVKAEKFIEVLLAWQKQYNLDLAGLEACDAYTPFSSYPDYYHCIHANFLEKAYYETKKFFYQSLLPAYDYFLVPSYCVVDEHSRATSDFNALYLGEKEIFVSAHQSGLEAKVVKLSTQTDAKDYFAKNSFRTPLLLMGNNYYLPSSAYYKSEEFLESLAEDRNLLPMNFSIFQSVQDKKIASSVNLNYFGQIPEEDFWEYWKNFKDFKLARVPLQIDLSFQVFPLNNLENLSPHNIDMLYEALQMNVDKFFCDIVFKGDSVHNFQKIFFGRKVFKEFAEDIKKNLSDQAVAISDIVILDMFKRIQKPQLFLNDILNDIVSFNDDFAFDLNKLAALIRLGDEIFEKLYKKAKSHKIRYEPNLSFLPSGESKKYKFLSKEDKEELLAFVDNLCIGLDEIYKSLKEKLEN